MWRGWPLQGAAYLLGNKIEPYLTEDTKTNPSYLKGLYVKDKTIKLLEENIRVSL